MESMMGDYMSQMSGGASGSMSGELGGDSDEYVSRNVCLRDVDGGGRNG